jgi:hypothetical protein
MRQKYRDPPCARLTDRASAAATCLLGHYPTFLKPEAPASCMRLLGGARREPRGIPRLKHSVSSWLIVQGMVTLLVNCGNVLRWHS